MNKLLKVIVITAILLGLTGCGNKDFWGVGHFTFRKIHIINPDGEDICLTVKQWTESEIVIEVDTEEYGPLFLSEGTYIMVSDVCPICEHNHQVEVDEN